MNPQRLGQAAAASGKSPFDCPYHRTYQPHERELWFRGFTQANERLRLDRLNGREPGVPRAEFSVERGRRAGKSIVGRSS